MIARYLHLYGDDRHLKLYATAAQKYKKQIKKIKR